MTPPSREERDFNAVYNRINGIHKDLSDKIDDMRDGVSNLVTEVRTSNELCKLCRPTVLGNGKDGVDKRLDRLEQWRKRISWVVTAIFAPTFVYGIYTLLQWAFLKHE